jgi:uncharacterized protein YqeY
MSTLTERIEADYKTALKAGERRRVDTLRLLKAGMERLASEKRLPALGEADVIQVTNQQAKQRRETIEAAKAGGRQDVLNQATEELAILTAYLPQPLSEEALKRLIDEAVQAVGPQQGQIMKYVMGKAAGAADGKVVSQLVAQRLSQAPKA